MKPYPKYKDSGVEWIGEVPEEWEIKKIKYCFKFQTGFTPPTGNYDYYSGGTNIWVTIADLDKKIIFDSSQKITDLAIKKYNAEIVTKGSLLYSFKLSVGKVGFAGVDCYTNEAIFSIYPSTEINLEFYFYSLPGQVIKNANENIYGAKLLNQELIKNAYLVVPGKEEQTAIANYLDRKTAEIDSLIANKERLIELYEEEKTAVINQIVTKGLDLDAPMKPSGIDWLGDIPEHWVPSRLKYIVEVKDGTHDTPDYMMPSDESFPLVTSKDIQKGFVDFTECKHISKKDYDEINRRSNVEENDIIMPMIGTVGGAVVVETKRKFSIKNVALFKTSKSEAQPFFLKYLIDSVLVKNQFSLQSRGGVQDFVSLTILKNIVMFNIPMAEQESIIKHIETQCSRLNAIIDKFKKQIELLKEYRTTLISEVVTGKIDVRDEVVQ